MSSSFMACVIVASYKDKRAVPFGVPFYYSGFDKNQFSASFGYSPVFKHIAVTKLREDDKSGMFSPEVVFGTEGFAFADELVEKILKNFDPKFFNAKVGSGFYHVASVDDLEIQPMVLDDYLALLKNMS